MLPIAMLALCVIFRIVPHPPNFAPVGATSVFAGRTLPIRLGIIVTLGAMIISDAALAVLRGYPLIHASTPFVYLAFVIQLLLGYGLRRYRGGAVGAAALGSIVFFLLSNFGTWVGGLYGYTAAGLVACYVAAIPFFRATLASDVIWILVLSFGYRWLAKRFENRGQWWVPVPTREVRPV